MLDREDHSSNHDHGLLGHDDGLVCEVGFSLSDVGVQHVSEVDQLDEIPNKRQVVSSVGLPLGEVLASVFGKSFQVTDLLLCRRQGSTKVEQHSKKGKCLAFHNGKYFPSKTMNNTICGSYQGDTNKCHMDWCESA